MKLGIWFFPNDGKWKRGEKSNKTYERTTNKLDEQNQENKLLNKFKNKNNNNKIWCRKPKTQHVERTKGNLNSERTKMEKC